MKIVVRVSLEARQSGWHGMHAGRFRIHDFGQLSLSGCNLNVPWTNNKELIQQQPLDGL